MESEYLFNPLLHKPSLLQYLEQSASSMPAFPPLTLNGAISDNTLSFDAALTSLAASSAGEEFAITELIARLGNIGGGTPLPLQHTIAALSSFVNENNNNNSSSSCYSAPVDSPHKVNVHGLRTPDFPAGYSTLSRSFNGRQPAGKERAQNRSAKAKPDKCLALSEADNSPAGSSRKRKSSPDDDSKENKSNSKSVEPPKDYIHVRARRGQATDSHSLAERVRREKISERMKLLQDLVPGCNKVTGKASMLDEIINYVQSLQRQVEFLSMKLASVNTSIDIDTDTLASKDMFHSDNQIFGQDSMIDSSSIEQLDSLSQGLSFQLPSFEDAFHPLQLSNFCEGDLQSIVDMGFAQDRNFNGSNVLKFEL